MLTQTINNVFKNVLLTKLQCNYVIKYEKRRSAFDATTYNQNWVPRQRLYHRSRKPRQQQWDDPNVLFPLIIPPLYKPNISHRHYIRQVLQKEERQRLLRKKQFLLSDIRSGDIVDITYQQTFQNDQRVTHRCFVLAYKRKKSLTATLQVAIRFGGMSLKAHYLIMSPKVVKIQLVSRGSGNFKSNLKHNWRKMTKNQLLNAKIRKSKVMKLRGGAKHKKKTSTAPAVRFDKIQSDNIKKIL